MSDPSRHSSLRQPLISSDEEIRHNVVSPPADGIYEGDHHEEDAHGHAKESSAAPGTSHDTTPEELNNTGIDAYHMGKRNIRLTLLYASIAFAGRSIWNQSVLAAFVYLIQHEDPKAVGFLTGVMGISQLLASFPTGYFADVYPRDDLLKFASFLGLSAVSATIAVCWLDTNYIFLVMALSLWGVYYGVANTTVMALFADSIQDGQRCQYFTQRSIRIMMGNMMGPLCALGMFQVLGDHWSVRDCAVVMTVGQIICAPAVILLSFFHDGQRRGTLRNSLNDHLAIENESVTETGPDDSPNSMQTLLHQEQNNHSCIQEDDASRTVSTRFENPPQALPFQWIFRNHQRTIPILVAFSDVISGLGSGLSIRYFPLFFMHNLRYTPVQVQIIYICSTVSQVVLAKTSQRLADGYFGRCRTTVSFKWAGILFMTAMIFTHVNGRAPRWVVGLLFVLRTGFMNSCGALTRSLLMDNVPSNERGKWSALESVNMFSWSGSAAIGGLLVEYFGLLPLFGITAAIQLLSSLVVLSLARVDTMPLVLQRSE